MRGNTKRIISLCLAVIIAVTTVGYAPPSLVATAMTKSKMLDTVNAIASPSQAEENVADKGTPSEAESPGDKATPSQAERPEDKATPSEAVRKFVQLEPEEVPDYYSQVKKAGKRFWKFEDRNGMVQYRDYGYVDGDAEFPLWYEVDQEGTVEDLTSSINLDDEYYSLAPFVFKSVVPDKKAWVDLSWRLFFDSLGIEEYDKENIKGFKNWDASSYGIWHLTDAEDDQGYHFYGTILNESKSEKEPNWYDSDKEGNVVDIRNLLMTSLATSEALQKLYYSSMRIINGNISVADKTDSPSTYDTADTLFTLWTPSWSGYTFLGWADYYNYPGGPPFGNESVIDHPQNYEWLLYGGGFLKAGTQVRRGDAGHLGNLYGMWKPNGTYTLQLIRQPAEEHYPTLYHGSCASNWYLIVGNPGRVIDLNDYDEPTLEGYTFAGWYSGTHGTGTHYSGSITLNSNMVMYANYTANTNTITFLDYNGEVIGEPQSVVTGDSAIPPQAPEIDGMDFVGWDHSFINVSKDMVIKAQYKKIPNITIKYMDAASSNANILKTETIIARGKATPPEVDFSSLPAPKTGYHYSGTWYGSAGTNMPDVDLECVETFDSKNYYKDSTLYLYPKQEGNLVKVTLHSNDGQDVTKVIEVQYDIGLYFSKIIDSQTLTKGLVETRTGYTFKGWASTPDAKYSNLNSVQPYDHDLYQVWDPITYYIIFDKRVSGESNPSKVPMIYDKPIGKLPEVTSKGLDFLGWYTYYTGGTQVTEETLMPDHDFNLYAQWSRYPTKVTYDYNFEGAPNPYIYTMYTSDYTYQQIYTNIANRSVPTRKGYTFTRWNTKQDNKGSSFYPNTSSSSYYYVPESRDFTVYAIWNPMDVYLRLYKNTSSSDTSILSSVSRKYDDQVGTLPVAQNGDKIFKGWYTEKSGGNKVSETDKVIYTVPGSLNYWYLYAQWSNPQNNVTFKDWDGTLLSEQTIDYGQDAVPPEPERAGYRFIGWDKSYKDIKEDTVLKAQYEMISKTLTLDSNGGKLSDQLTIEKPIAPGESIDQILMEEKDVATRKYYTFDGWYTDPTGGSKYPENGNKMPDTDLTIYAHWERSSSEVVFKDWDGSVLDKQEVAIGADATAPADPDRSGYTFTGWDKTTTNIQDHTILTAQYAINSHKLTLDGNGGTLAGEESKNQSVNFGASLDQALVAGKAGASRKYYTFDGWYTDKTGGSKYPESGNEMPDTNLTIYAHWERSSSEVVFKDWDESVLDKQEVAIGADAMPPAAPERNGYTFTGWDKLTTNIQDHTILTAQYTVNSHKLTLVGNGGTLAGEESKSQNVNFGDSFDQVLADGKVSAARKYYTFSGWYTEASGGSKYPESGNKMPDTDLTIYAHWERISSEVVFKDWNGSVLDKQEVAIGADATAPTDPERTGYTFTGWDKPTTNIQNHVVITAQYSINGYLLTLDGTGGTLEGIPKKEVVISFDQSFDQVLKDGRNQVTRPGYHFDGWYNSASGGSSYSYSGNQMPSINVTVYAHWSPNTYEVIFDTDHVRWTGEKQKEDHTFDTELGTLPVPEIYGWKFNGWWTGKNRSGTKITEHSMVEPRDVVYYGSWEPVTYEVHLVSKTEQPDGESVQTFTINQKYDQEIGGLPIPEEKGYTFNGWYDADHNKINPHTIFRPDSGAEGYICHAEWKANSYKIRFVYTDADGKQKVVEIDRDYFMQLGTLPLPEKPGYTFAGWFNESGEKITSESWVEVGNVEYKAKWNANQYTIHFKSNSESISDPEDKTVTYALPIGDLPILYETGYAFLGWYTEPEGGIRIKETTLAALGDQTYYGHWSIKWIYIGNGTYRKPGADGKWNTTDDELWWYGPDGIIGTDDDRQIHIIPGGSGTYIDNGDGTYIMPGAGGSWENPDHWWRGPDGIIGTDDDRQIHIIPGGSGTYIDNGDGTYITPGAGGSWENPDHWWRGPDGIIGTDDDRQIHIIPGGSGTYIDNGDGTYITPGAGGSWENPDHWWYGPDGEIGTDDNRQIHIIPGGSGTYIDNGDGTYITPGADGSWENPDHWWRGPDGIIGTDDDRQIHIIPGGTGPYIDNGDGTYITPGADGSWENPDHWWYGLDREIGTDDDRQIHRIPGGTGPYIDNGDGTYITPGADGSWENPDHWWYGPDHEIGTDDDRQIHRIPEGTGPYIDNGDGTYITPGVGESWENPEHWSSGPDGEIGTSDDKKIDNGDIDPKPTNPEPTNPEPTSPEPIKPDLEDREEKEIITVPPTPIIDSTAKPEVPDTGGTFTVNPNDPLEVTYTKPDGTTAKDEWVGDGKDWYHVDETGKLNYDWYLEGDKTWYKLNKEPGDRFGAALSGWNYEPMDDKRYFFDPATTKMLTGWQLIDNKWYYFTKQNESQTYFGSNPSGSNPNGWKYDKTKPGKPYGSMYQNERTPDGYMVDENGVWKNK